MSKNHFNYKAKHETELRTLFFSDFLMIYDNVGAIRAPLKQDLALEFCRRKKTKTLIF